MPVLCCAVAVHQAAFDGSRERHCRSLSVSQQEARHAGARALLVQFVSRSRSRAGNKQSGGPGHDPTRRPRASVTREGAPIRMRAGGRGWVAGTGYSTCRSTGKIKWRLEVARYR